MNLIGSSSPFPRRLASPTPLRLRLRRRLRLDGKKRRPCKGAAFALFRPPRPPASSPRLLFFDRGIASGVEIRFGSPIPAKEMVALVSRRGRRLQRYWAGRRLVVGCIPYRLKMENPCPGAIRPAIEVLVVSSQKGPELMFPKGGWELDETMAAAASREAFEEAGVTGNFEGHLGRWLSEDQDKIHYMFAMEVTEVLQQWPEMNSRERKWVSVAEARQVCKHSWMREALDKFEELRSIRPETDLA